MMMGTHIFMRALLMVLMVLTTGAAGAQSHTCQPAAGDALSIGAVFAPGSLFAREWGEALQGAQAMVDAINTCGGIDSRPVDWRYLPANNRSETQAAVRELLAQGVTLIVGSGSPAVSEALAELAASEGFVYWEVSEALTHTNAWAFSPRPTYRQIGARTAGYIQETLLPALGIGAARVAIVYEQREAGQAVAAGLRRGLGATVIIDRGYTNVLTSINTLARSIRDQRVNVVVATSFDDEAGRLWLAMQQADANVAAWIHIGGANYRRDMCARLGNTDGLLSVGASGPVSQAYREVLAGTLYTAYLEAYQRAYGVAPTERADLAAAGMHLLLTAILPAAADDSAESIRAALLASQAGDIPGLMGYGYSSGANHDEPNAAASIIIQQQQSGAFCTVAPDALATCAESVQPFPTWRQRVLLPGHAAC